MARKKSASLNVGSAKVNRLIMDQFPGMSMIIRGGSAKIPYFILNMDVTEDKKLKARKQLTKVATASNPTSLYSYKNKVFFIADGTPSGRSLFYLNPTNNSVQKVFDLPYPARKIYYAGIDDFVYFGCRHFIYKLNLNTMTVTEFPDIGVGVNRSSVLFDGLEERHVSELTKMIPCDYLCFHQSRLVGSVDKKVVFSEPFLYEATREFNFLRFNEQVTGLASTGNILYVGTRTATYIVSGTMESPEIRQTPIGCMAGSMQTGRLMADNRRITVPIWVSLTSVVAGLPDGNIIPITEGRLDLNYDIDSEAGGVGGNSEATYVNAPYRDMQASANTRFVMGVIRNGKVIYTET